MKRHSTQDRPSATAPPRPRLSPRASTTPAKRRVLIVDDHPLFRDGVRMWIDQQADMTCCGEADSAASAHQAIATQQPDLVLLDLSLGSEDGFQMIKSLRTSFPHLPLLVISENELLKSKLRS